MRIFGREIILPAIILPTCYPRHRNFKTRYPVTDVTQKYRENNGGENNLNAPSQLHNALARTGSEFLANASGFQKTAFIANGETRSKTGFSCNSGCYWWQTYKDECVPDTDGDKRFFNDQKRLNDRSQYRIRYCRTC